MMKAAILLLFLLPLSSGEQQRWVDPFDMTGESGERPVVPEKRRPLKSQPLVNPLDPMLPTSPPVCPVKRGGIDYSAFYRQLVRQLWTKVGDAQKRLKSDNLLALVHVSARNKHVLDDFVKGRVSAVQEVNNAFDMIFHTFSEEAPAAAGKGAWFQPAQLRDVFTFVIITAVIACIFYAFVCIARCGCSGFVRCCLGIFCFCWLWTWIVMYKKKVANKHAILQKRGNACHPAPWLVEFGHYFANYFVVVPDHCTALLEEKEVDPWLEVNPLNALVHTITQMLLEPMRLLAEKLVEFIRTVCAGLPVLHAAAALAVVTLFSFLLLILIFRYRIRMFLFSLEPPAPRDSVTLTPEAAERLERLITSTMDRQHRAILRRNSELLERALTQPRPTAAGDGPLKEEDSAEEAASEEEGGPPENLL